jgi:hypothetical protein
VRIIAAANPIDIAAASGGWDLSAPAANRVGHINWPCPDIKMWTDWLLGTEEIIAPKDVANLEMDITAAWPAAWGTARGSIAGFLSAHSTHLHAMPAIGSPDTSKAWPSPRSWEYAARALAGAQIFDLTDSERDEFVGAFVGEGAAGEFFTWLGLANLPDSFDLLDGHVKWKHKPSRLDITMAVFGSAVGACVGTPDLELRKKRAERMWELLAQATDTAPDLIVNPAKALVQAKLSASGIKVASKILPILEAANIQEAA